MGEKNGFCTDFLTVIKKEAEVEKSEVVGSADQQISRRIHSADKCQSGSNPSTCPR